MRINQLLVELFIESHKSPPTEIILDFDATDDPVHGKQEGRFFHGYYDGQELCAEQAVGNVNAQRRKCIQRDGPEAAALRRVHLRRKQRRVIARIEHTEKGENPRFITTTLAGEGQQLYEQTYCARGEVENRIKEQQLGLFADRTCCHDFVANQFRLLLSSLAYVLIETLRRTCLASTELAQGQVSTIRLKLLKIGALVQRSVRRIVIHLSESFPMQPSSGGSKDGYSSVTYTPTAAC